MKNKLFLLLVALLTVGFFSCKRDYTIGGSTHDAHVNMTTYDYLKTNPLFDTLVLLIDRTGLKEEVNSAGTFFAPSDYAIYHYVQARGDYERLLRNDENLKYTFDSLDYTSLKDSLRAYMFKEKIELATQNQTGHIVTATDGEKRVVNVQPDLTYVNDIFTQAPLILYLNKIVVREPGESLPATDADIPLLDKDQWLKTRVQTSGIITTTGILHVLNNDHTMTYFDFAN